MQARVGERSPVGWCSWYYYFTGVREADVVANLESLASLRDRLPCDYVMIDDGYQRAVGDWFEPNQKFPHGMRWLAQRIRAAGFEAGIWTAPFLVRPEARLFRERPEWLLRTAGGRPRRACWNPMWSAGRPAYALDTTHPGVLEWLSELARTLVHQWGYRVLKLDFLYAAALPGVRFDAQATRAQALRRGLQAIRDGAGDDAFLLGCGCPLGPAVGLVDGMRIGADVAPYWTNWISRWLLRGRHGVATKHAIRNTLTRAFMHRRLWLNDPDCLMVRGERTRLSLDEVRSLAAVIGLTDGMLVVSDRMDELPEERRALLEQAYDLTGGTARVADLFAGDLPELLRCAHGDGEVIGVFNFTDRPAERAVEIGAAVAGDAARELWSDELLPLQDGRVRLGTIPPHGCRLLWVEPPVASP
jgi:alpha-galactosidase